MKEKFQEFLKWVEGQGIELSDKTNIYQCFDLAYSWIFYLNYPKSTIQHLYAYQIYTEPREITLNYFDLIKNTPSAVPQAGDLVIWSNVVGVAGHVAIATGQGDTNKFKSLDQNWQGVSRAVIVEHTYKGVIGWLRPKKTNTQEFTDQTKIPGNMLGMVEDLELQALRGVIQNGRIQKQELEEVKSLVQQIYDEIKNN